MPEESTVKQEQMTCEEDWPVGKKAAFFTLTVIILLAIIDFMDRQIVASLLPYIKEEYGATDSQLGLMISIVNYSMVIFVIPSGYLIDRWSRKKMLSLMAIIWSLATAACGLAGTFSHLVAARFFIGTGEAGYNPAGQTLLSASFPRRLRASVCAAIPASMWLGAPLGLMIGAFIAEHWGWRHAFGVVAVPGIALGIVALFCRDFRTVRQDIPGECGGGEEPEREPYWRAVASLLKMPTMPLLFVGQATGLIASSSLIGWLPSYFNRVAGVSVTTASSYSAIYMAALAAATLIGGPILDGLFRKGTPFALRVQTIALIAGFLLTALAFSFLAPGSVAQVSLLAFHTLFTATVITLGYALVLNLAQPQQRATATSLIVLVQNGLGNGFGALLTGVLSDVFTLSTSMLLITGSYLVSAVCFWAASHTYEKDLATVKHVTVRF